MTRSTSDVIVVGGGVVGCACAYFLARDGLRVTLLERDAIAGQASGAAAGMLAPIGEAGGPGPLLSLGLASLRAFPTLVTELRERSGIDPEYETSGVLRVAASVDEAARLRALAARLAEEQVEWLDAGSVRELEPRLGPPLAGALWSPREAHVRSPLFARALAGAAESCGARVGLGEPVLALLREGRRVVGVETPHGRHPAGHVVLASGAFVRESLAPIGATRFAPVEPVRGQIVTLEGAQPAPRTILWRGRLYLVPKRDGRVVVGATEERVGFDRRVTAAGVSGLLHEAMELLPELGDWSLCGAFAGLRPATPDGLPAVGPVPGAEGLLLAAGHHRNGVLLAPLTAALVRDWVLGKERSAHADALLPQRFA